MPFLTGPSIPNELAGASAADPVLAGIGLDVLLGASTLDIATINSAAIDQVTGAIQSNLKANLSPAATTTTNGTAGTYTDATQRLAISSTAGLGPGDELLVSHPAINGGAVQPVKIATVPTGTEVTLVTNPFAGTNRSGIAYQVLWRFAIVAGANGSVSSAAGQANYAKLITADAAGNANPAPVESVFYIRDAPTGAAFIAINGGDGVVGTSGNTLTPALSVLAGWANRGGIVSLAWANHSGLGRNDFKFSDGSVAEKALAAATGSPLTLTAGDGVKAGRLIMRGLFGGSVTVERDVTYTLDSTAPTIAMYLAGR